MTRSTAQIRFLIAASLVGLGLVLLAKYWGVL